MKNPKWKITERDNFDYVNGDYNRVLCIRVNVIRFSLEGILYLYKSCPIDKVWESYSVWIPQFRILITIEPNTLVWIDIGESLSLSCGSCSAVDKNELLLKGYYLVELGLGWRVEISVIGSDYVNHPTRSKFELGDGFGLNVLKVATCHTSVKDWIDMCYDLGRVKK